MLLLHKVIPVNLKFFIPFIPQARLFPPMSLEAFRAFTPTGMLRLKHKHKLVVLIHLGEQIIHTTIFEGCEVLIEGVVLKVNLIPLKIWEFDIILGMD